MSARKSFTVLGGDSRQNYLLSTLLTHGYTCHNATNLKEISPAALADMIYDSNLILGAIPFCQNGLLKASDISVDEFQTFLHEGQHLFAGALPKNFTDTAAMRRIICHDYMKNEEIAIFNSIATAEGLICDIIQSYPGNLYKSPTLILGFGRCARTLADRMRGLGCQVTVCARNETALAMAYSLGHNTLTLDEFALYAPQFDILINTIPSLIITKDILEHLTPDNYIYDIASIPGGVDFESARLMNIHASAHLSLPGKYSPKTSAEALFHFIMKEQTAYMESD